MASAGVSLQLQNKVFTRKGANKKKREVEATEEDEDADSDADIKEEADPKVEFKGEPGCINVGAQSFYLTAPCCGKQTLTS
ncbi:hypothetical protein GGI42DRAFT_310596 [Trichoderma sp. SZMC 28013]